MSKIERYTVDLDHNFEPVAVEDDYGMLVRYEDYQSLQAEVKQLREFKNSVLLATSAKMDAKETVDVIRRLCLINKPLDGRTKRQSK